jgi:AraC-like DNA-binding protein
VFVSRTDDVARLLRAGHTQKEIARVLGVTPPTVAYHVRKLGIPPGHSRRRYDWDEVQRYYDEGHSVRDCAQHFGFSTWSWHQAVKRGRIVARPTMMPIEEVLTGTRVRSHVKWRLLEAGLKENRCEICGITDWLGGPLSMALHHVNGDGQDNRLENLQMLCPNCHSQTENFSGRAKGRREAA